MNESGQVLRINFDHFLGGREPLRHVRLGSYQLVLWDTHKVDRMGKSQLGYALFSESEVLFCAEDFYAPAVRSIDSDEVLRSLVCFLTLRPGDTDSDYFEGYSHRQLEFAMNEGEELSMWADDEGPAFEEVSS